MKSLLTKQTIYLFAATFMLLACGGDGKNGAASTDNLLSEDYIFIDPIPEPTPPTPPTPPEPTPPSPTPPRPTPPSPTPPTPTPPEPTPDNTIPVAHAGEDQKVSPATLIKLDGSRSYDADDDPLTYQWVMVAKPSGSTATLSGDTTVHPTFKTDKDGRYRIRLVVNDGKSNSHSDYVFITVNTPIPDNTPPTAIAKGSKSVVVKRGEVHEVILDGSESLDDGLINPLTYSWKSGPYIVNNPTVRATPSCSDDWQRCYNAEQRPICSFDITLTVFDGEFSDTDTSNLKVDYSECEHEPIVIPDSIHLAPAYTQTIPVTKHKTYKLWAYYADSNPKDVTQDAVLSTSNTSIATIDANGKVTGISVGDVLIIGEYAGQKDTAPLTVTD